MNRGTTSSASEMARLGKDRRVRRTGLALLAIVSVVGASSAAFLLHFNLSAAGSVDLLLVLLIALRFGFLQATVASVTAVLLLNYLFTPPIFQLTVADPRNWVSLATFEATALLVSGLSAKARRAAAQAELQRMRAAKLYEFSRAVLLIHHGRSTGEQLIELIREFLGVESVDLWVVYEEETAPGDAGVNRAFETFVAGKDSDAPLQRSSERVLRLGTAAIGAMKLCGWTIDPLLADAVASLAAIAFERAHAVRREGQAEAERNIEQLRTAVLDGLAHSFKTPLTAIQTASSGLLAIERLTSTQAELVTLIDEQTTALSRLTTRLLQTAALEAKEMHLRRTCVSMVDLLRKVVEAEGAETAARTHILAPVGLAPDDVDVSMMELALQQLVDNAAKYSEIGRAIEITVSQVESETLVVVANIGPPIRAEERTRIFERFYRGADAAYGPSGTGLGLSIVKKTAEAHGGRVWVECSANVTRFLFSIHRGGKVQNG